MSSLKSPMIAYWTFSVGLEATSRSKYCTMRYISNARCRRADLVVVPALLCVEATCSGYSAPGTSIVATIGQRMISTALGS